MSGAWIPVVVSLGSWLAIRWSPSLPKRVQGPAIAGLIALVLISALALPADLGAFPIICVMTLVGFTAMKLHDLGIGLHYGRWPGPREQLMFMLNSCCLVERRASFEPRVSSRENLHRLALGSGQLAMGVLVLMGFFRIDWLAQPFWLEHTIKSIGFFIALIGVLRLVACSCRFMGVTAREPTLNSVLPPTPADFWRRYNRVVHQYLNEDVFKPLGGARRPFLAIMACFLVSGLLHEYLLSMAAGRFQGLQTAFFLLHGLAVATTARVKPTGWRRWFWVAGTLVFNIAASVLFLASVHEVIPFYANPLPAGLGP